MKNVLVIGSGGREHALAWKLSKSPKVSTIFVAPGNGGSDGEKIKNISIPISNHSELISFAQKNEVALTVVGPDDALASGIVDVFKENGLTIFGPTKKAAQIESSKAFSKDLMKKYGIKTAGFKTFTSYEEAEKYLENTSLPIVIKASGLALGKGVYICHKREEAETALKEIMLDKKFGNSGSQVVVEEFLSGTEISIHAFCDGENIVLFPTSQDHKTIYEDGKGPNTGGMGTVSPLLNVTKDELQTIEKEVVKKTIDAMKKEDVPFSGILYPGLMKTEKGFYVLEFNARFGDPETQSYMRLLKTDLYDTLLACANGNLKDLKIEWDKKFAVCVVLASGGYPVDYKKGFEITGIEEAEEDKDVVVFHAGTRRENGKLLTNGGRVLNITAVADTLEQAIKKAYKASTKIHFEGKYLRKDIGRQQLGFES